MLEPAERKMEISQVRKPCRYPHIQETKGSGPLRQERAAIQITGLECANTVRNKGRELQERGGGQKCLVQQTSKRIVLKEKRLCIQ